MINSIVLLTLYLVSFSLLAQEERQFSIIDAKQYIEDTIFNQSPNSKIDNVTLNKAIDRISKSLADPNIAFEEQALFKQYRIYSLEALNFSRFDLQDSIYLDEVELIIEDYEFLQKKAPDVISGQLLFTIGRVYFHFLENKNLAYDFWRRCGEKGHVGCMNIMAGNYFSGKGGLEQNITKSISWHKKVIATGTEFNCAGIFSSARIQTIAFLLSTEFKTFNFKENYLNKTRLQEEVQDKYNDSEFCNHDIIKVMDYIFAKGIGFLSIEEVDFIEKSIKTKVYADVIELLKQEFTKEQVLDVLDPFKRISNYCDVGLALVEYSRIYNKEVFKEIHEEVQDSIFQLDCEFHQTLIYRKQTQGDWSLH